jgi:ATP-dependent Lon protease
MTQEQKVLSKDEAGLSAAPSKANAPGRKPLPEDAMIIVPMRSTVLFPGVISPITVGRPGSVAAAQEAVKGERRIGFLLQRDAQ